VKFSAREMEELAVLIIGGVGLALGLDELEDEWTTSADVVASGEKIAAN